VHYLATSVNNGKISAYFWAMMKHFEAALTYLLPELMGEGDKNNNVDLHVN